MIKCFLKPQFISRVSFTVCLIVIEFLSTTIVEIKAVENSWDKLNHFSAFFVLYMLMHFAYKDFSIYIKVFLLFIFAVHIEIVQIFIPGREFSILDIAADVIGILMGTLIVRYFKLPFSLKLS